MTTSPCTWGENGGTERLGDLPKVTQQVKGRPVFNLDYLVPELMSLTLALNCPKGLV